MKNTQVELLWNFQGVAWTRKKDFPIKALRHGVFLEIFRD